MLVIRRLFWYRDQLHRPFGASLVTVLVPRACALGFPESPLRASFAPETRLEVGVKFFRRYREVILFVKFVEFARALALL